MLKLLGICFPENPKPLNIVAGLINTKLSLGLKRIEDLANLPEMTDPNQQAAMRILVVLLCKGWRKLRRLNFQYS